MNRSPILLWTLLFGAVLVANAESGVMLTVYNNNLALVRDTRPLSFVKGVGEVLFRDVAAQIDATSVHFAAPGVTLLEQNFDYDLVSPSKLMEKYVDREIEVVAKGGEVARGTLLSASGGSEGQLVLRLPDGSLRSILLSDNVSDIRYPSLPEGLITKPTLRWLVNSNRSGESESEVSYLTSGLSWHADYVAIVNEAASKMDFAGWVTLDNQSGASYKNAKLKLIAGEIHRAETPSPRGMMYEKGMVADMVGRQQFAEQAFFEYHLYTLQRPSDVLDRQTKQLSLFPNAEVTTRKVYEYDWRKDNDRVTVSIEFENRETDGLGMALPAGRVRVYQQGPDGSQEFVGEDNVEHTPKNEKLTVQVGKVFDVVAERTQKDYRQITPRVTEQDIEVKLRNHKKERIEIKVVDQFWGEWQIIKSSHEHKKTSSTKVEFQIPVEPEQEAVLTYTVRTR